MNSESAPKKLEEGFSAGAFTHQLGIKCFGVPPHASMIRTVLYCGRCGFSPLAYLPTQDSDSQGEFGEFGPNPTICHHSVLKEQKTVQWRML
jgi:hypothetical protein